VAFSLENWISILSAIVMSVAIFFWVRNFREESSRDKANEPLVERGKKELEERAKKLEPFIVPRSLLYCDDAELDNLFSQCQLKASPTEIASIKKMSSTEFTQGIDTKLLSAKGKKTESEERVLKEIRNREMKYEAVLKWLYDEGSLIIGLEEPIVNEEMMAEEWKKIEPQLAKYSKELSKNVKAAFRKALLSANERQHFERLKSAHNKFIAIRGNFVVKPHTKDRFELLLENNANFFVHGLRKYCTAKGKDILSLGETKISLGILGFVSDLNEELYSLLIEPIVIYRLSSSL